jgi:hypothetical protein
MGTVCLPCGEKLARITLPDTNLTFSGAGEWDENHLSKSDGAARV